MRCILGRPWRVVALAKAVLVAADRLVEQLLPEELHVPYGELLGRVLSSARALSLA